MGSRSDVEGGTDEGGKPELVSYSPVLDLFSLCKWSNTLPIYFDVETPYSVLSTVSSFLRLYTVLPHLCSCSLQCLHLPFFWSLSATAWYLLFRDSVITIFIKNPSSVMSFPTLPTEDSYH